MAKSKRNKKELKILVNKNMDLIKNFEFANAKKHADFVIKGKEINPKVNWKFEPIDNGFMTFAGEKSPLSQTVGIGFKPDNWEKLIDKIEDFYFTEKCDVNIDLNISVEKELINTLLKRGYKDIGQTNILMKQFDGAFNEITSNIKDSGNYDTDILAETITRGFTNGKTDTEMYEVFKVYKQMPGMKCYHYEKNNKIAGCGFVKIFSNIAALCGASTLKEYRRQGIQTQLMKARVNYALEKGCNIFAVVTIEESLSEKNYIKNGFKIVSQRKKFCKVYKNQKV